MSTWLLTGGTRGLGRALAEHLLKAGAAVAMCARTEDDITSAQSALSEHGAVLALVGSVDDADFIARMMSATLSRFGGIDGLVLNAATLGDPPLAPVSALDAAELRRILEVNLIGPLLLLKKAHPYLLNSPSPRLVVITSDASSAAYPGWAGYGISKAALELLARTYGSENPHVLTYVVDPGDMDTALHRQALPNDEGPLRDPGRVAAALAPLWTDALPSGRWTLAGPDSDLRLTAVESHD